MPDAALNDFFQDWAAARYHLEGKSPYADQEDVVQSIGRKVSRDKASNFNAVNAHPPTSILLFLPLASLPYPDASRLWSAFWLCTLPLSFWLILRGLDLRLPWWSFFPIGLGFLTAIKLFPGFLFPPFPLHVWAARATSDDWNGRTALPWQSLTAMGVHTYVLVVFFVLGIWASFSARHTGAKANKARAPLAPRPRRFHGTVSSWGRSDCFPSAEQRCDRP